MLRVKLTKLKQVCTTALLPRIFKETKSAKNKIDKCAIEYLSKVSKSSDSRYKDEHYEKQMRIIEKCFGEKPIESDLKEYKDDTKDLLSDRIVPINEAERNKETKRKTTIAKIFGTNDEFVQTTTAKVEEEKLTQKVDKIDETPHVEAGVGKVDGFNSTPKVLGHDPTTISTLNVSEPSPNSDHERVNLDDLAKRCLGAPVEDIDKIILKELKNMSRESSLPLKVNFPTDDSAQKYFSQIFERKTKGNTIVSDVSNTHLDQSPKEGKGARKQKGLNQFQSLHLDTVPIFAIDENGIKYKETEIKRDRSPGDQELLLDIPAILDPYGMQAIPFYEYVSKEKILLQDIPKLEEVPATETIKEAEMNAPMNEEVVLQTDDVEKQVPETNIEAKEFEEMESDGPKPIYAKAVESPLQVSATATAAPAELNAAEVSKEVPKLSESDISRLLEYKNAISAQHEAVETMNTNTESDKSFTTEDTQYVLTSTNEPTSSHADNPAPSDTSISAISNEFPTGDKRTLELPNNTAISANQNPDEYFEVPKDSGKSWYTNITDTKITDNILDHILATDRKLTDYDVYGTAANDTELMDNIFDENSVTEDTNTGLNPTKAYDAKHIADKASDIKSSEDQIIDVIVNHSKAPSNKMNSTVPNYNQLDDVEVNEIIDKDIRSTEINYITEHLASNRVTETVLNQDITTEVADTQKTETLVNDTTSNNSKLFGNLGGDASATDNMSETLFSVAEALHMNYINNTIKDIACTTAAAGSLSHSIAYSTMPQFLDVKEDSKENPMKYKLPVTDRKAPITHVLVQPEPNIGEAETGNKKDKSICSEDTIPLSMLLKRVRERNRVELIRTAYMKAVARSIQANKNRCIPPLDKSKPKTSLQPNPCKPKPKSDPCKVNPCKPAKKDPCAKFIPFFLDTIIRSHISVELLPSIQRYNQFYISTSLSLTKVAYTEFMKKWDNFMEFLGVKQNVEDKVDDVVCARDFDPWIPIPSWPIPKVEEKKPLVCPKDGCKLPVRPIPSNTDKPCTGMPRKLSPTNMFLTPLA